MSQLKKLAGETAIYGLGAILPKVVNFIILAPYLTRILNNENYGIYGIMYAYTALLMALFTFRLETAFFRFATIGDVKEKAYSSALSTILIISASIGGLIYFNASSIASLITTAEDARYVKWFAFILAFDALAAIPFARLRLENKAIRFSLIKILNVIITAVIIIFFLSICPSFYEEGASGFINDIYDPSLELDYVFLANLAASAMVLILLLPELKKMTLKIDKALLLKMLRYSWPLILVGVAAAVNQAFDRVFISKLLPGTIEENTAISGIYNGASKIAVLMSLFATAFNYAAEPFFFKTYADSPSKEIYAKVALAFTISACAVFLGITLFLDQVQYLIGSDYRSGVVVVPILLMAYLFLGLYYNFSVWYKLKDKTIYGAIIACTGAVITIVANIILIQKIGYVGASWSVLICFICMCSLAYIIGRRYFPVPYRLGKMLFYILFSLALYYLHYAIISDLDLWPKFIASAILLLIFLSTALTLDRKLLAAD